MRRRAFMAGLLAASAPTMAHGQEQARIAILHSGFPNRTPIHLLFEALGRLGYEHGRTATIDLHGGEGNPERLSALVAHIAAQKPHVVIAITAPAAVALKRPELSIRSCSRSCSTRSVSVSSKASPALPATSPGRRTVRPISAGSGSSF